MSAKRAALGEANGLVAILDLEGHVGALPILKPLCHLQGLLLLLPRLGGEGRGEEKKKKRRGRISEAEEVLEKAKF